MFKNILSFWFFVSIKSIDTERECYNIFFLITKIYVEIDNLVLFALFLLSKMLMKYNVQQFKVTKYVMSHTIIIFQLLANAKY